MTTHKTVQPPPQRELHDLAALFARAVGSGEFEKFLPELFTPNELHDLVLRLRLLRMLREGETQRKIAASLRISLCKITRGARIMKDPCSTVAKLLKMEDGIGP